MNTTNDGNLEKGLGDPITILETGEKCFFKSHSYSDGGSIVGVEGIDGEIIGHVKKAGEKSRSGTFTVQPGSTLLNDVLTKDDDFTYERDGFGWLISKKDIAYSDSSEPVFTFPSVRASNGLIVSPCRDSLGLVNGVEMVPVSLSVTDDLLKTGVWTVSGVEGLSITGSVEAGFELEGTPTSAVGIHELTITYTEEGSKRRFSTSRTIDVEIKAA